MKLFVILSLAAGALSAVIGTSKTAVSPKPDQVLSGRGLVGDWTCISNGLMPHSYCCQQVMDMIFYNCMAQHIETASQMCKDSR